MARLELERRWVDNDGMLQARVAASNGATSAEVEPYVYPDQLSEFGQRLSQFGRSLADEAILECGTVEAGGALTLRALVIDQVGHSALEVKMDRREAIPRIASVHFYLACNPAELNRLGAALAGWASDSSQPLMVEW